MINSLSCRCVSPIPLPPPTRHNRYGHTLTQVDAHTLALFGGLSHRHGRPVAFSDLWLIYVRAPANHIQTHPPACVRRSIAYPAHTIKPQQRFYRCSLPRRTAPPRCGSPSPASPSSGGLPRRGALGVCFCMCVTCCWALVAPRSFTLQRLGALTHQSPPPTHSFMLPPPTSSSNPYWFARPDATSAESVDPAWCVPSLSFGFPVTNERHSSPFLSAFPSQTNERPLVASSACLHPPPAHPPTYNKTPQQQTGTPRSARATPPCSCPPWGMVERRTRMASSSSLGVATRGGESEQSRRSCVAGAAV